MTNFLATLESTIFIIIVRNTYNPSHKRHGVHRTFNNNDGTNKLSRHHDASHMGLSSPSQTLNMVGLLFLNDSNKERSNIPAQTVMAHKLVAFIIKLESSKECNIPALYVQSWYTRSVCINYSNYKV
jgi:hypothetical protein